MRKNIHERLSRWYAEMACVLSRSVIHCGENNAYVSLICQRRIHSWDACSSQRETARSWRMGRSQRISKILARPWKLEKPGTLGVRLFKHQTQPSQVLKTCEGFFYFLNASFSALHHAHPNFWKKTWHGSMEYFFVIILLQISNNKNNIHALILYAIPVMTQDVVAENRCQTLPTCLTSSP